MNCKIWIGNDKEFMEAFQRYLFRHGYQWASGATIPLYLHSLGLALRGGFMMVTYCREEYEELDLPVFADFDLINREQEISLNDQYKAKVNHDGSIDVGCQHIDFDKIEEIYLAAKGKRDD